MLAGVEEQISDDQREFAAFSARVSGDKAVGCRGGGYSQWLAWVRHSCARGDNRKTHAFLQSVINQPLQALPIHSHFPLIPPTYLPRADRHGAGAVSEVLLRGRCRAALALYKKYSGQGEHPKLPKMSGTKDH